MKKDRSEYLKLYAREWRKKNNLKFIQAQLKYWQKKLLEFEELKA